MRYLIERGPMSSYCDTNNNTFQQYPLSTELFETLAQLGFHNPTEIQQEVIPLILDGKDVIAKSQTGTGKTAAFAIPICEKINWEENYPQALILEPTRELSVQVQDEIFYIGRKKRLKVPAIFGGFPIDKQIQTLKQKSHIVVGTPGRVMDHIRRGSLKLQEIKYLVIDEADLMLDMGVAEEVNEIITYLPESKQIMLFSATIDNRIEGLTKMYMPEAIPVILESKTAIATEIKQVVYEVETEDKYQSLLRILIQENPDSCMIFCATREMVNVLYQKLRRDKVSCGMLHGEMEQSERLKMIDYFRIKRYRYLIATDVAARGIDVDNISLVVNYDFPTGKETYLHRVGRTGRNGKSGKAISLVCEDEKKMQRQVEAYINIMLTTAKCPDRDKINEKSFWDKQKQSDVPQKRKGDAVNHHITRLSIGGGKKSKMRAGDVVGALCNLEQLDSDDIGIIDIRESLTYVEILNGKGPMVLAALQEQPIKGKIRKVRKTRNPF